MFARPSGIPRSSGCYLFRNAHGQIIYVGKALSLASRLGSYFQRPEGLDHKTQALMTEATSVEWIVTPTELDALVLENELIKDNQPRYNMRLKDDKSFPYVALDTRTRLRGALHHARQAPEGRALLRPLRRRARAAHDDGRTASRPSRCARAPSTSTTTTSASRGPACSSTSASARGRAWARSTPTATPNWWPPGPGSSTATCGNCAACCSTRCTRPREQKHYEAAAKARDGLEALERAASVQNVVLDDHSNLDVLAVASDGGRAAVVRFRVRFGRVIGRTVHLIDRSMDEDDAEILESVLTDIYDDPTRSRRSCWCRARTRRRP